MPDTKELQRGDPDEEAFAARCLRDLLESGEGLPLDDLLPQGQANVVEQPRETPNEVPGDTAIIGRVRAGLPSVDGKNALAVAALVGTLTGLTSTAAEAAQVPAGGPGSGSASISQTFPQNLQNGAPRQGSHAPTSHPSGAGGHAQQQQNHSHSASGHPAADEMYVVQQGDNLTKIAHTQAHDGESWEQIYEANRGVIGTDPNLIKTGTKLIIEVPSRTPRPDNTSTETVPFPKGSSYWEAANDEALKMVAAGKITKEQVPAVRDSALTIIERLNAQKTVADGGLLTLHPGKISVPTEGSLAAEVQPGQQDEAKAKTPEAPEPVTPEQKAQLVREQQAFDTTYKVHHKGQGETWAADPGVKISAGDSVLAHDPDGNWLMGRVQSIAGSVQHGPDGTVISDNRTIVVKADKGGTGEYLMGGYRDSIVSIGDEAAANSTRPDAPESPASTHSPAANHTPAAAHHAAHKVGHPAVQLPKPPAASGGNADAPSYAAPGTSGANGQPALVAGPENPWTKTPAIHHEHGTHGTTTETSTHNGHGPEATTQAERSRQFGNLVAHYESRFASDPKYYKSVLKELAAYNPEYQQAAYLDGESCDLNVSAAVNMTLIHLGEKPNFPALNTGVQYDYMMNSPNWKPVPNHGNTSDLNPGVVANIGLGNTSGGGAGHTWIYDGNGEITSASYESHGPENEPAYYSDFRDNAIGTYNNIKFFQYVGQSGHAQPAQTTSSHPNHRAHPQENNIPSHYGIYSSVTSNSGLSVAQLNEIVAGTDLAETGGAFYQAEQQYGINALFMLSHAANESGWGSSLIAQNKNNLFGYGADDANPYGDAYTYSSKAASINDYASKLKANYLTPGGQYYNGDSLHGVFVDYSSSHDQEASTIANIMNSSLQKVGGPTQHAGAPVARSSHHHQQHSQTTPSDQNPQPGAGTPAGSQPAGSASSGGTASNSNPWVSGGNGEAGSGVTPGAASGSTGGSQTTTTPPASQPSGPNKSANNANVVPLPTPPAAS